MDIKFFWQHDSVSVIGTIFLQKKCLSIIDLDTTVFEALPVIKALTPPPPKSPIGCTPKRVLLYKVACFCLRSTVCSRPSQNTLLRTLLRTLFPSKTHCKTASENPSQNLLQSPSAKPPPSSNPLLRSVCCRTILRLAPNTGSKPLPATEVP